MGLLDAFNGHRDLFRVTGRPDSECKFLLTAPDRFGTTVDGIPTCDMRSSFTKDLTAQPEQARSKGFEADVRSCAFHLGIRPLSKPQLAHITCNRFSAGFLLSQNDLSVL
jgi:hypothetical protein